MNSTLDNTKFRNIGTNDQKIWDEIRNQKEFTVRSLSEATQVPMNAIPQIIGRMEVAGLITIARHTKPNPCKLIKDVGAYLPRYDEIGKRRPPTGQERIWSAIKVLQEFTIKDLTLTTVTDLQVTRRYVYFLEKAGYVTIIGHGQYKQKTYRFNRRKDTGFLPPSIINDHDVYDRNLQQIVWSPDAEKEVCDE